MGSTKLLNLEARNIEPNRFFLVFDKPTVPYALTFFRVYLNNHLIDEINYFEGHVFTEGLQDKVGYEITGMQGNRIYKVQISAVLNSQELEISDPIWITTIDAPPLVSTEGYGYGGGGGTAGVVQVKDIVGNLINPAKEDGNLLSTKIFVSELPGIKDNQTNGTQKTKIIDPSGNVITSKDEGLAVRSLDVNIRSGFDIGEVGILDASDVRITPAKESGGNLATIKTNTDPLVAPAAGGYVRQDSTGTIAKETGGNLATVKTNTDSLVTAAAGGYVRQDSTGTIAKESGGNLADIKGQQTSGAHKTQITDSIGNAVETPLFNTERRLEVVSAKQLQKYTDQGKHYSYILSEFNITPSSVEKPAILISNGAGTAKSFIVTNVQYFGTGLAAKQINIKWYLNPTITANGTAATPFNRKTGGAASVMNIYSAPTLTLPSGTMFHQNIHFANSNNTIEEKWDEGFIITPGQKVAITVEANANNVPVTIIIQWVEV